ncbi:hypothetical protein SAMN04489723_12823 [Algoriphagus aquimarinus]|uniref:Uncharacterized protein n=1 Tax=Algoriphagus aquimarinus TaxID=237018 RepID=A0A1I1CDG5_9BACT|nr:hypothetical protein SAMN04489723_12823 [Algoriphagus aquimarinus]
MSDLKYCQLIPLEKKKHYKLGQLRILEEILSENTFNEVFQIK